MIELKTLIQDNYEAFYLMTLSSALLNSAALGEYDNDAKKIISFIGKAYGLNTESVEALTNLILGEMMKIGLLSDYYAIGCLEYLDETDIDNLLFYEIKGNALVEANQSNRKCYARSNSNQSQEMKTAMKSESFHHPYAAFMCFNRIKLQASYGDMNSTRQLGIMYALGIGTEKDLEKAKLHLERCIMWSDAPSIILMKEILSEQHNVDLGKKYISLYELEKSYIQDGIISLPEKVKAENDVKDKYLLIALIRHYLIVKERLSEIDIAFLSAIEQPGLSVKAKLNYICRYKDNLWKNAVIAESEKNRIGL